MQNWQVCSLLLQHGWVCQQAVAVVVVVVTMPKASLAQALRVSASPLHTVHNWLVVKLQKLQKLRLRPVVLLMHLREPHQPRQSPLAHRFFWQRTVLMVYQ